MGEHKRVSFHQAYRREERKGLALLVLWTLVAVISPWWISGFFWLLVYTVGLTTVFLFIWFHYRYDAIRYRATRDSDTAKPL